MDNEFKSDYTPRLTLDPAAAQAAAPAPAPDSAPQTQEAPDTRSDFDKLSPEEQAAVREFARQIDVTDAAQVLNYGAAAQKNISDFSAAALGNVRSKDLGEVGGMLSDLVVELKGFDFDEDEKKGFFGFFKKAGNRIAMLKAQYDKAEVNVDKIVGMLENHWIALNKDIALLDKMYDMNQGYYKELTMYILAGKIKLDELRTVQLPELTARAQASGLPEDAQAANDLSNMINRFEKKLHDLELTRVISVQMGPQIRMIQNNDSIMAEKIQSSISNTIPLWKSQMVLALSLHHSRQAMEAQREVTDLTNKLLRKNADALRTGSADIARESERGVVDLETLKHTNEQLIATLEEVRSIQEEGRARRAEAEAELGRIENELNQKLLDIRS